MPALLRPHILRKYAVRPCGTLSAVPYGKAADAVYPASAFDL
jgi:hypothetical protein